MIEPRDRAIVDGEGETALRVITERQTDRRLDGAAMGDGNHILSGMGDVDPLDGAAHPVVEIMKLSPPGAGSSIGANQ